MCSETVGLRTRPVGDQKIGLGLVHCGLYTFVLQMMQIWCCFVSVVTLVVIDFEGHSNSSTIYGFSILYLEHYEDQQWRSLILRS